MARILHLQVKEKCIHCGDEVETSKLRHHVQRCRYDICTVLIVLIMFFIESIAWLLAYHLMRISIVITSDTDEVNLDQVSCY